MARMARVVIPNYPHHVTQRGNRRQKTFFCEDDYRYYIELVTKFSRQSGTKVWAYCLMPNHVHLVMVPGEEDGLRATLGGHTGAILGTLIFVRGGEVIYGRNAFIHSPWMRSICYPQFVMWKEIRLQPGYALIHKIGNGQAPEPT